MSEVKTAKALPAPPLATGAESSLARKLRDRSPEAGAELYDCFGARLYRFALPRLLGDTAAAEEIVLESLALAARDILRFDARRASLATWLFGLTRRQVNLELRKRRRRTVVPVWAQEPLTATDEIATESDLAAEVAGKLDAQRKVAALAAVLSSDEMEVLLLRYVADLEAREIGKVIHRSERAVHAILHRARTKAREKLVRDDG